MKKQTTAEDTFSKYCEDLIRAAGLKEIKARAKDHIWELKKDHVTINLFEFEEDYLFVTAEIAKIKKDSEELYRYVLDKKTAPFLPGKEKRDLYLSYRIHTSCLTSRNKTGIIKKLHQFLDLAVATKKHIDRHFSDYIK